MNKYVISLSLILFLIPVTILQPVSVNAGESYSERNASKNPAVKKMFAQYADSVVFITGEFADPAKKELKEYFHVPKVSLRDGIGTGFFITSTGYIMTNAHGLHKSIDYIVELHNGKRYDAQIVGFIFEQDLALLKIELDKPVKPVVFRQCTDVQEGDEITSIGHPNGLKYTCAKGMITGTDRRSDLTDIHITLENLLQTDMPINPGASGGPWFDSNLRVIGMTESKGSESDNIAFGVASSTIIKYLPQLYDFPRRNYFVRGFDVVLQKGYCVVKNLDKNSPAAKAGLKENDIILKVNGEKIYGLVGWLKREEKMNAQTPVNVTVKRSRQTQNLHFTFDSRQPSDVNDILWKKIGLKVRPLIPKEVKLLGLKSPCAYMITDVDRPRFEMLEHKPVVGDVLGKIAYIRPHNMEHLGRVLEDLHSGDKISMVILRVTNDNTNQSVLLYNINSVSTMGNQTEKSSQSRNTRKNTTPNPRQMSKSRIDISDFEVR